MYKKIPKEYLSLTDIVHVERFMNNSKPKEALQIIRDRLPIDRRIAREEC